MTLNKAQFAQFVENYVSDIVEGLDVDQLSTIAFDLLVREYETYTEEQIVNEIKEIYDEEYAQDLLESATAVPVA
jgi:threonine dehydratase